MQKTLTMGAVGGMPIIADVSFLGGPRTNVTIGGTDYIMQDINTSNAVGRFLRRLYGMSAQPAFPITCEAGATVELLACEAAALVAAGAAVLA